MKPIALGLDFGTTNSSLAVVDAEGRARLAEFPTDAGPLTTYRSLLYFQPSERGLPAVHSGPDGIRAYLERESPGRLMQSLKSYLASRSFRGTQVYGVPYKLEELLAILLRHLREAAERQFGELPAKAVVGRPVHFVDSKADDDDDFAVDRLRAALGLAGFRDVTFLREPVAAAHGYRQRLEREQLVLIADFGGGTTDLSLVALAPPVGGAADAEAGVRILGTGGVGIAGDRFDGRLVQHLAAPLLGQGSHFRSEIGRELPVPAWLYMRLREWHHVSFLNTRKTLTMLDEIIRTSSAPEAIRALHHLIGHELGFELHRAVQSAKNRLTSELAAELRFAAEPVDIAAPVSREAFEGWIGEELAAIRSAVDRLLLDCATPAEAVGTVFLTGGSSLVPAVRGLFATTFGAERLRGGEELTTVALGLAMHARDLVR